MHEPEMKRVWASRDSSRGEKKWTKRVFDRYCKFIYYPKARGVCQLALREWQTYQFFPLPPPASKSS
jgi:hypothetical protein